jgi:hypothetical protein
MGTVDIIILVFASVIALGALIILWNNRRKKTDTGSGFLEETDGNTQKHDKSSTRLFSFLLLLFLFMGNLMLFTLIANNPQVITLNFLMFTAIFNFLFLLGIFVPKQLAKIEEIRKTIELMKMNGGEK